MITDKEFEELFRTYFVNMCQVAFTIVKDRDQARDIAQQTFVRFWDKRDSIDAETNTKAYLHRAVINTALNHIEKQKRLLYEDDYTDKQQNSTIQPDRSDFLEGEVENAIKKAIGNLPDRCQTVFSLSRLQGMSNNEIANSLDISVKAVEKHIGRALKELRITLKPYLHLIESFLLLWVGIDTFQLFI